VVRGLVHQRTGHKHQLPDARPLAAMRSLLWLNLSWNQIPSIAGLTNMTKVTELRLGHNQITSLAPLANLPNLHSVNLSANLITDLTPLVMNAAAGGLGPGDEVWLGANPLSSYAQTVQIPMLRNTYGVTVHWP
jgi:hypothetical protein